MKKYKLLSVCLAALALAACNDWLDVKPSTQLDRDELLSNEKGYGEALRGVYTQMCNASLYGREMTWGVMDVLAGNYNSPSSPVVYNYANQYAFLKGEPGVNGDLVDLLGLFWSRQYNAIAGLNSLLGTIDENRNLFTGDNYAIVKGEATGLRAFLHFDLLRMFADVYDKSGDEPAIPYVIDLAMTVTPVATGKQALEFIIADLTEALKLLENDPMRLGTEPNEILASIPTGYAAGNTSAIYAWHNRRFHFNYYAAKATLARAYLWKGDKENALKTALEVIGEQPQRFPWVQTGNLTTIETGASSNQDRTFATEHIFALNVTNMSDLTEQYLNASSTNSVLPSRVDMFTANDQGADPRYKYLYTMYSATVSMLSKFDQPGKVYAYFKYRLPLIRISEMYYIAAECAGTWQQGLEYLETVRHQRGMGSLPLTGVTGQATLQAEIFKEYRKEFVGEGQLWFYYKRQQSATITGMTNFKGVRAYIFPIPENEELYGNRQ